MGSCSESSRRISSHLPARPALGFGIPCCSRQLDPVAYLLVARMPIVAERLVRRSRRAQVCREADMILFVFKALRVSGKIYRAN